MCVLKDQKQLPAADPIGKGTQYGGLGYHLTDITPPQKIIRFLKVCNKFKRPVRTTNPRVVLLRPGLCPNLRACISEALCPRPASANLHNSHLPQIRAFPGGRSQCLVDIEYICLCLYLHAR